MVTHGNTGCMHSHCFMLNFIVCGEVILMPLRRIWFSIFPPFRFFVSNVNSRLSSCDHCPKIEHVNALEILPNKIQMLVMINGIITSISLSGNKFVTICFLSFVPVQVADLRQALATKQIALSAFQDSSHPYIGMKIKLSMLFIWISYYDLFHGNHIRLQLMHLPGRVLESAYWQQQKCFSDLTTH